METAKTKNVITYQPQTEAQIQKIEKDERREEMQDEAAQQKERVQQPPKTSTRSEQQADEEVYIGREGQMIRRGEESKEMRDRHQDVRQEYRCHRREKSAPERAKLPG